MSLKTLGGSGVVLGVLLLLIALAQPATVPDSSTTCVDSTSFGRECSTVEYDRPNTVRSQLFGGAVFLLFSSGIAYAVGRRRGGGQPTATAIPSDAPSRDEQAGEAGGTDTTTLREQLEAKQREKTQEEREAGARGGDTAKGGWESAASDGTESEHRRATETGIRGPDDRSRTTGNAGSRAQPDAFSSLTDATLLSAAGLLSAFLTSGLLSAVITFQNDAIRTVSFALLAFPGMGLYYRYRSDSPGGEHSTPGEERR